MLNSALLRIEKEQKKKKITKQKKKSREGEIPYFNFKENTTKSKDSLRQDT